MGKAESSCLFFIFFVDDQSPHLCLFCLWGASGGVHPWLVPPSSFSSLSNFAAGCRWWPDILQR